MFYSECHGIQVVCLIKGVYIVSPYMVNKVYVNSQNKKDCIISYPVPGKKQTVWNSIGWMLLLSRI